MKKAILLAPMPPPVGGIGTWALRMLDADLKDWHIEAVDEKIIGKREVFGDRTKRNLWCEMQRCFGIWRGLSRALKDTDALVVHANIPATTLAILREYVCACITKARKRKFVMHFHCTVPNIVKSAINRFVLKRICNISDGIILLNQQSVDYLSKLTETPLYLIPNFVDTKEIAQSHQIRQRIEKVLYVGGVIESKGCMDLLAVAGHYPDVEFRLAGKAEIQVTQAAEKLPNVKLLGMIDRETVAKELADTDVFAFLSHFPGEGFSIALTEAMAAGVPCLVTDWAANKDMIEDKGGVVVPIRDVDAAVAALAQMMPAKVRQAQSIFNIEKIKTAYADTIVLSEYMNCYEEMIQR